eukprot:10830897-Lingulodinium_polyedra.AAC.1
MYKLGSWLGRRHTAVLITRGLTQGKRGSTRPGCGTPQTWNAKRADKHRRPRQSSDGGASKPTRHLDVETGADITHE